MHSAYASSVSCSRIQVFLLHHFGEVFNGTFHRPDFFLNSRLFFFWRLSLSCCLPTVLHLVDVIWTTIDITMAYEWSMSYEEQYHNNYRYHDCPGHWKMSAPKISAFQHMNQNVPCSISHVLILARLAMQYFRIILANFKRTEANIFGGLTQCIEEDRRLVVSCPTRWSLYWPLALCIVLGGCPH